MKKSILLIGPFLFSLAIQGGAKYLIVPEKPVTKTVRFSVFSEGNYSSSIYKYSKAQVELSIWKYKSEDPELLWSTTIDAGKLKNYPGADNPLFREVHIPNIKDRKETLVAGYRIVYNSRGSKISYDKGYIVSKGDKAKELEVSL